MALGSAATGVAGPVEVNAVQSAANAANPPQAVLDDPTNGSVVLHLGGEGAAPTAVVNAHAGTAGSASVSADSTDLAGTVTIVEGSAAWAIGAQVAVTYAKPHISTNKPVIVAATQATGLQAITTAPSVVPVGLTGFTINFGVAESAANTYVFTYIAGGN